MSALPELHSVRHDHYQPVIESGNVVLVGRTEAAHRRFGQVREAADRAEQELDRFFYRYEAVRDELEAVGVLAELRLSPVLSAAYRAWQELGPVRVEIARPRLTEAPIPARA